MSLREFKRGTLGCANLECLRLERARLDEELQQVNDAMRGAKRRLAEQQEQKSSAAFSLYVQQVALIMYFLSGHNADACAAYLQKQARRRGGATVDPPVLARLVEDWFMSADIGYFVGATQEGAAGENVGLCRRARTFLREWELAQWVRQQNRSKGIAPSTSLVLERFNDAAAAESTAAAPAPKHAWLPSGRMWARRWRLRWGARLSRIPATELLPLDAKRAKARAGNDTIACARVFSACVLQCVCARAQA